MLSLGSPVVADDTLLTKSEADGTAADEMDSDEALTADELALVKAAEAVRIRAIEGVYGAVVAIYGNDRQGGGSGVLFDPDGFILTNHHVVAAAGIEGWAGLADGKLYRWKLVGTDPGGDVAIIQLQGRPAFPVAALGDSNTVKVGQWAMAMGNPFALAEDQKPTVTLGIVSGIERFQSGAGLNTLVYGNCIQVDSSINPGNSGGPLFNLHGQVIGINGRASFMERGRVNVGLGYAISVNQIKNFIPDLLATKIAQHGTLDALFSNRGGEVICHTLNLDSAAARHGLQLGDRLVAFEGRPITDANQFTNLIWTLPADWPVELVYERDDKQYRIWVRLIPLPYEQLAEPVEPKPAEEGGSPTEKPAKEKPQDGNSKVKKPENPAVPPPAAQRKPVLLTTTPGTIRDEQLNLQNGRRILERWRQFCGCATARKENQVLQITDSILQDGRDIGQQVILLAGDGRFRIDHQVAGAPASQYGFDGKDYWQVASGESLSIAPSKALLNTVVAQVAALAAVFHDEPLAHFGKVLLDGGDKAGGQCAYRLKTVDAEGDWFYVWLSLLDQQGTPSVRLLKAGADRDADKSQPAVLYSDWRTVGGIQVPHRRQFVRGLGEQVVMEMVTTNCESLQHVDESVFEKPNDATSP
jgi:S1-C subfamily serine protease